MVAVDCGVPSQDGVVLFGYCVEPKAHRCWTKPSHYGGLSTIILFKWPLEMLSITDQNFLTYHKPVPLAVHDPA